MRKVQWIAQNGKGEILGVFPTKRKAFIFFEEDEIKLTKIVWNGYYHSEKPLQYDPYREGIVTLYEPMF